MALVDQYGRKIQPKELVREIAAPSLAGIRSIWNQSVVSGLTPQRLAGLLSAAADGDHNEYLALAEEMEERDLHYGSELAKRKLAVSRLPLSVESYSDDEHDLKLADAVRDLIRKPGFRGLLKDQLDALGKGYAVAEIIWDKSGSTWTPARYAYRDPRFFQFDRVSHSELRLRDEMGGVDGLPLEPYKFIVHTPKIKSGLPIRGGLARVAAWAFMCKGYTVKDWLAFAEVFGMPLRLGKYRNGATPADISVLKTAVANLGSDAAAVFPESMQVELVEAAKGSGANSFFKLLAEYLDDQVSKGVLGQTASSSGTPGKLGNDTLQSDVRDDIRDDDAEQLEDTLNRDLVRAFIDLNYGPQQNYPTIALRAAKAEDITALVNSLKELVPLGMQVEQSVVRDRLGLPDPDQGAKPEDLLGVGQAAAAPMPALNREQSCSCPSCTAPAKALNAETSVLIIDNESKLAAMLATDAAPMMDALINQAALIVNTAGSLQEISSGIERLAADYDIKDLGTLMAQAFALARLTGSAEVTDEH